MVECLHLSRLHDPGEILQPIQQLRPIGLGVDRMQFHPLDKGLSFGSVSLGIDVHPFDAFPGPRHRAQRTEIAQRVGIDLRRLGIDIVGNIVHRRGGSAA
jgi:hypothetical protein